MTRYSNPFLLLILFFAAFSLVSELQAQTTEEYPSDSRIKMLRYDPSDIFTIYTLYGYQTNIEFARSEEIQTISVGDRSLWQIIPSGSRLFIRPMDDDVSTNMTVITNLRTYQFDLKSGSGTLEENPRMVYVARFTYEDPQLATMYVPTTQNSPITPVISGPEQMEAPIKPLVTPPPAAPLTSITPPQPEASAPPSPPSPSASGSINQLYTYTGPDELAPVQAYDDGQYTYLRFSNTSHLPTIRTLAADGKATPVAYTIRDGVAVVPTVAPGLMLSYERTNQTVYVYNEAMSQESPAHGQ